MDEYKTEKAVYTPEDFLLWQENNLFEITPKFQRRPVWRTPARSYFIDTLLRGMTVPPLYFRMTQNKSDLPPIFSPRIMRLSPGLVCPTLHYTTPVTTLLPVACAASNGGAMRA